MLFAQHGKCCDHVGRDRQLPGLVEISLDEETRLLSTTKEVTGCGNSSALVLSRGTGDGVWKFGCAGP